MCRDRRRSPHDPWVSPSEACLCSSISTSTDANQWDALPLKQHDDIPTPVDILSCYTFGSSVEVDESVIGIEAVEIEDLTVDVRMI